MMTDIKVGDKVRVRKDAPRVYRDWDDINWTKVESYVADMDGDVASIKYEEGDYFNSDWEYLPIPLKYLIKVEDEAKEPKFKVGQFAMFKGRRVEIIGYSEHYPQMYRVFVLTENYHTDAKESDLEPYTKPSLEKDPSDMTEETANNLSNVLEAYGNAMETIKTDSYWDAYTADLAKEVALKVAHKYNDPDVTAEYAVSVAKAVVEGLKRK